MNMQYFKYGLVKDKSILRKSFSEENSKKNKFRKKNFEKKISENFSKIFPQKNIFSKKQKNRF